MPPRRGLSLPRGRGALSAPSVTARGLLRPAAPAPRPRGSAPQSPSAPAPCGAVAPEGPCWPHLAPPGLGWPRLGAA